MVHKPKHKVHSFKGLLADGVQDEINLERSNLNLAYRITKFELIPQNIGSADIEDLVLVWREEQASVPAVNPHEWVAASVDFSNPDLLAAGYFGANTQGTAQNYVVIFDNILFSRNIWVTNYDHSTGQACNYYIELEEVPVNSATLMQLKLGVARKLDLKEGEYIPPD